MSKDRIGPLMYVEYLANLRRGFSHEQKQALFQKYSKSLNIKFDVDQDLSAITQILSRPGYDNFIKDLKVPGTNQTIAEKLNSLSQEQPGNSDAIKALKELSLTPVDQNRHYKALETFRKDMRDLREFHGKDLKEDLKQFNPIIALSLLYPQREAALKNLTEQQALEKNTLISKFEDPVFKTHLQQALSIDNDEQIKVLQKEAISAIDKKHQEEKKTLEETMNKEIFAEHKKEFHRLIYLSTAIDNFHFKPLLGPLSPVRDATAMAENIKNISAMKDSIESTTLDFHSDSGKVDLKHVKLEDLDSLTTMTGLPITLEKQKIKNKEGVEEESYHLSLQLRGSIKGFARSTSYDLLSLMHAARATGLTPIEINITSEYVKMDPNTHKPISGRGFNDAQKAYAAALKAGYHPSEIRIKINGQPEDTKEKKGSLSPEELFANNPNMLENAKKAGEKTRDAEENSIKNSVSSTDEANFKEVFQSWKRKRDQGIAQPSQNDSLEEEENLPTHNGGITN